MFQHLNQLRVLDLSHNNLKRFFVDIPVSVEVLFLDHNSLLNGSDIFQRRMQFLRYLSLGHTGLRQVPRFSSFFPVLQYLDVNDDVLWLDVTAEDLVQFKELRVLSISPRLFSGSNKMQKCQEFAKAMKTRKIEVRNLMCKNGSKYAALDMGLGIWVSLRLARILMFAGAGGVQSHFFEFFFHFSFKCFGINF